MALTATLLDSVKLRVEQEFANGGQIAKAGRVDAEAAKAVLENQTAKFTELKDPNKDLTVQISWLDPCFGGTVACVPKCTITGGAVSSVTKDYTIDQCRDSVAVSIGEEVWRKNRYDQVEAIALAMVRMEKSMDEYLSAQVLLTAKANAGINFWTNGTIAYNAANNTTYVPDANYNVDLIPYLEAAALYNQTRDNYKISNFEFWEQYRRAQLYTGNDNGKGLGAEAGLFGQNLYFDPLGFAAAGIAPEDMFIIEKGAMALITKARFSKTPVYRGGTVQQWRWSKESNFLPGVVYDWYSQETCDASFSSTQEDIVTNIVGRVRYTIPVNPLGCTYTYNGFTGKTTGIWSLTKGNAPV